MEKTLAYTQKKKKHDYRRTTFMILMMLVPVLHFAFFWIYVNIDTIKLSLERFNYVTGEYTFYGLGNYKWLWNEIIKEGSVLPTAFKNSFILFLWNDLVIVPISMVCAFVLYKRVPLSGMFKVIFFFPSIISVAVLTFVFGFMFDTQFGIVNKILERVGLEKIVPWDGWFGSPKTAFPLILFYGLWTGIGANIVLLTGAITRIPDELFEAAALDGIGSFGELFHIVIPLVGTNLSTLLLMGTTVIFTYFLPPLLLTGTNAANVGTYTIAMYIVTNVRDNGNYTIGATIGIVCILLGTPIVVATRKGLEAAFPAYEY